MPDPQGGPTAPRRQGRRGGRNHPSSHDESSADFRIDFFAPLGDWLIERRPTSPTGRLLDFGCADLLLARRLDGVWTVDGYDEWDLARDAARTTLGRLREPGVVHDRLEDVPEGAYDAVVVNSLFQYVPTPGAARDLFADVEPLLAPAATVGIVITDAVSDGASPARDLWDVWRYALRTSGLVGGVVATVRGIRSGKPAKRHFLAERDLRDAAAQVGLDLRRLPRNLSVFSRRATFVLTRRGDPQPGEGTDERGRPT